MDADHTSHRGLLGGRIADLAFVLVHAGVIASAVAFLLFLLARAFLRESSPLVGEALRASSAWSSLLVNTTAVAVVTVAVGVGVGVPLAVLAFRTDLRVRGLLVATLVLLTIVPSYVSAGVIASLVNVSALRGSAMAAGVVQGTILIAPCTLLIGIGLRAVPASSEEAAMLDAGSAGLLWHVSLPQARWSVAAATLLVVYVAATDYFVTDLFQVRTFAEEVYTSYALFGLAGGPAFAALPLLLLLCAAFGVSRLRRAAASQGTPEAGSQTRLSVRLGRLQIPISLAAVVGILLVAAVPLWSIIRPIESFSSFVEGLRVVSAELWTSAWTSAAAATVCAALAVGIAWMMARSPARRLASWTMLALLALPAPMAAIALIQLLNRPGLLGQVYDSPIVLVIAYVVRFLPWAVVFVLPAAWRVSPDLEEAARLDGAGVWGVHRAVYWPLCLRDVRLAWLFVLVFCFGEVAASVLVAPPGYLTAGVRFFTLIHYGFYRDCAVICLANILLVMVPWLLLTRVERIFQERHE